MKKTFTAILMFWITAGILLATFNQPFTGEEFNQLIKNQRVEFQSRLEQIFSENDGYQVSGPMPYSPYSSLRVICPDLKSYDSALTLAALNSAIEYKYDTSYLSSDLIPYENTLHTREFILTIADDQSSDFMITTTQGIRFRIWVNDPSNIDILAHENGELYYYAVYEYLARIDSGMVDLEAPDALVYGLPASYDIYAPDPPYVIEGYQNYKDFLYSHREIDLEFISGVEEIGSTGEILEWFKVNAPRAAFPNKEKPKLQEEYRKFFERGGDVRIMQTLTKAAFDTLASGEYFFAVGASGKIRFARELLREEVERIENETGRKVARANHAFLFPGEPILTAGAFWINAKNKYKLEAVSAQSGHYFYSNITATIKEDIVEKSDYYLTTLGHFFDALDSLKIDYQNVLISKF